MSFGGIKPMDLNLKIKHLRKNKKMTQNDLADKLKIAKTTISAWERGANTPPIDQLEAMAQLFEIPISYFFAEDLEIDYTKKVVLPIYGEVSCGNGLSVFQDPVEYQEIPKEWVEGGTYFCLRATGDSMVGANVQEGDLLLVREQPLVENGEIAVVIIDDTIQLKRVYRDNGTFTLISENPTYPPRKYDPNTDHNIRIVGKLKKAITSF